MIFKIKQTVSHEMAKSKFIKESHIIGMDLAHAITMINASEEMKRQLRKSYRAEQTDHKGRKTVIEIIEQVES